MFTGYVSRIGEDGELYQFAPGDPVPEWMDSLVDDLAATSSDVDPEPKPDPELEPDEGDDGSDPENGGDDESDTDPEEPPNESWTIAELTDWAEAHDVDLDGATKKSDILDIINAYLEA